jgi:hypothetical protein
MKKLVVVDPKIRECPGSFMKTLGTITESPSCEPTTIHGNFTSGVPVMSVTPLTPQEGLDRFTSNQYIHYSIRECKRRCIQID